MITPEMIEAAARALCIADRKNPDQDWRMGNGVMLDIALEPGKEQRWRTYECKAKAALTAAVALLKPAMPGEIEELIERLIAPHVLPYTQLAELRHEAVTALRSLVLEVERRVSVELLNVERETCDRIRSDNDRLRERIRELEANLAAARKKTIEECIGAVADAGGQNEVFHCEAIRALAARETK